jgi:hypothetical protein
MMGVLTAQATQKTTRKLLGLLMENPSISRAALAELLSMTEAGVKYHLNKLKKPDASGELAQTRAVSGRWFNQILPQKPTKPIPSKNVGPMFLSLEGKPGVGQNAQMEGNPCISPASGNLPG